MQPLHRFLDRSLSDGCPYTDYKTDRQNTNFQTPFSHLLRAVEYAQIQMLLLSKIAMFDNKHITERSDRRFAVAT